MIKNPHCTGSWLVVEVVAKILLTRLDIVPNPHTIRFELLMEVVCHNDTRTHTHTHTHIHMYLYITTPLSP